MDLRWSVQFDLAGDIRSRAVSARTSASSVESSSQRLVSYQSGPAFRPNVAMERSMMLKIAALFLVALVPIGCAPHSPPPTSATAQDEFPLSLRGDDTRVTLDFNAHPTIKVPHDLEADELCYLTLDNALIICTEDGSYLLFGPEDGVILVKDNPLSRLRPAGHDPSAESTMQMFGSLFLIAASVDRLPDALADYLQDPGPHRRVAMTLARDLIDNEHMELPGSARGGTFAVSVHLTDSGRDKLMDALQSQNTSNGVLMVRSPSPPSLSSHSR